MYVHDLVVPPVPPDTPSSPPPIPEHDLEHGVQKGPRRVAPGTRVGRRLPRSGYRSYQGVVYDSVLVVAAPSPVSSVSSVRPTYRSNPWYLGTRAPCTDHRAPDDRLCTVEEEGECHEARGSDASEASEASEEEDATPPTTDPAYTFNPIHTQHTTATIAHVLDDLIDRVVAMHSSTRAPPPHTPTPTPTFGCDDENDDDDRPSRIGSAEGTGSPRVTTRLAEHGGVEIVVANVSSPAGHPSAATRGHATFGDALASVYAPLPPPPPQQLRRPQRLQPDTCSTMSATSATTSVLSGWLTESSGDSSSGDSSGSDGVVRMGELEEDAGEDGEPWAVV